MTGQLLLAWYSPHPPIIIPEVGKGEEVKAAQTIAAMQQAAQAVAALSPETVIIFGPHGQIFSDAFTVLQQEKVSGDFASFGAPHAKVTLELDQELAELVRQEAETMGLPIAELTPALRRRFRLADSLDHGVAVPLWYLAQATTTGLPKTTIINISGLPWEEHYALGAAISQAIKASKKRVAVIASGDLSHRLTRDAPAGFHAEAHLFDEQVQQVISQHDVHGLQRLAGMAGCAGECGLRPLAVFLGCFDGTSGKTELLSYEGPYGVGYLVALRKPVAGSAGTYTVELYRRRHQRLVEQRERQSPPARLARYVIEEFVRSGRVPESTPGLGEGLPARAGVFVSLKKHGELRGCIGTTEPTQPTLQEEIIRNAISACAHDPRFSPVEEDELEDLSHSVDVLGQAEEIGSLDQLDPAEYGVIVESKGRKGLLLPDLDGVDTAEQQVSIARRKAGIGHLDQARLFRFRVTRYH